MLNQFSRVLTKPICKMNEMKKLIMDSYISDCQTLVDDWKESIDLKVIQSTPDHIMNSSERIAKEDTFKNSILINNKESFKETRPTKFTLTKIQSEKLKCSSKGRLTVSLKNSHGIFNKGKKSSSLNFLKGDSTIPKPDQQVVSEVCKDTQIGTELKAVEDLTRASSSTELASLDKNILNETVSVYMEQSPEYFETQCEETVAYPNPYLRDFRFTQDVNYENIIFANEDHKLAHASQGHQGHYCLPEYNYYLDEKMASAPLQIHEDQRYLFETYDSPSYLNFDHDGQFDDTLPPSYPVSEACINFETPEHNFAPFSRPPFPSCRSLENSMESERRKWKFLDDSDWPAERDK
ncbi:hypothetical protein O9G_002207 [Rozella allomycis CSF55]|uniref:Uncharacterized protein n=1 Tax=Rozella allomycis (strain CSF55) TaxID=988480 RepID=A0A075AUG4_ROZAC|nr:hypothetical protein O9G_002207 [Rozella allomycis CSF55]|eukprot:EPZ32367.1 hypothetical protein O9G_002207 [Rozella allomycis CSF55]